MKAGMLCLTLALAALGWGGCASSPSTATTESRGDRVVVTFDHPEKFTDVQSRTSGPTDEHVLDVLRDDIMSTAGKRIPAGSTLTMTFTDIDLAGSYEPWRVTTTDIRMMREVYPPRLRFTWVLMDANGATLRQGKENLIDPTYLTRMKIGNDPYFYDEELINDWIDRTFR